MVVQHLPEHDAAIHSEVPAGVHHWNAYRTSPLNCFAVSPCCLAEESGYRVLDQGLMYRQRQPAMRRCPI